MVLHNVSAVAGAGVAITSAIAMVTGPVVLNNVDPRVVEAAITAASVWNTYAAPPYTVQRFDVHVADLRGSVVGQVYIPCPAVCNVTVDASYSAVVNVLIHEFGHGLGLPDGARSNTGMVVGDGNHWHPENVDPHEIMTERISDTPRLAKFTVDAIMKHNYACDVRTSQCPHHDRCVYTFGSTAPGVCWPRSEVVVVDDSGYNGAVLLTAALITTLAFSLVCCIWC